MRDTTQLFLYVFLWAWELKLLGVSLHNHLGELEQILIDCFSVSFKAGFHQRRSHSTCISGNQKRRAIDLVKIKHWFCLWLCRLWSSENCIVGVARRSGRINQWQYSTLQLAGSSASASDSDNLAFYWIMSDGVVNGIGRNGNVLILPNQIPSSKWLRLRFQFSIFTSS